MKNQQIDIPLFFFSIAFFTVLIGLLFKLTFQSQKTVPNKYNSSLTSADNKTLSNVKATGVSINYDKPIVCNYNNKESSFSAQMNGTNISATINNGDKNMQNIRVQGDCLYRWNEKEKEGQKKCGIGGPLTIWKQLLSSGLASFDSLEGVIGQTGKTLPFDINAAFKTCTNVASTEASLYIIPKGIDFKEKEK
jgi:hypothetical protein